MDVLGGPTTVLDIAGHRVVMDPTFDPPGPHVHLTKTSGPAVTAVALGRVDVVLVSHDEHPDNLDAEGRRFALAAPLLITHPRAAARFGGPALGLEAWQTIEPPAKGSAKPFTVQAVPAVHGPADGERDGTGNGNAEVAGFVLSGPSVPTVYLSGDNASIVVVKKIADRVGPIDVAVLFAGGARMAVKQGGRQLTLTSQRAAAAAEVLGARVIIPAHIDSWSHISAGIDDVIAAFDAAGIGHLLALRPTGVGPTSTGHDSQK